MSALLWVPAGSVAAGLALLTLVAYLARHRGKPGANWFLLTLSMQALWCVAYGVGLVVPSFGVRLALEIVALVALSWLGPLFLAFAFDYTGRSGLVRSLPYGAVLLMPLGTAGLLATLPYHDLVWRNLSRASVGALVVLQYDFGPWAFVLAVVNSLCVALAAVLLVGAVLSYGPLYRKEAVAVAVSTVPVTVGLLLWFFRVGPYPYLNLATVLSLPHAALDAYAFASSGMFESNPTTQRAAEQTAFEGIPDPVLVLDPGERVVKFNAAAADRFGFDEAALGIHVSAATGVDLDLSVDAQSVRVEADDRVRSFNVLVEPLQDPVGERVGYTVVFQDVTREREREQHLEVLNRVLRHNLRNEMTAILGFAEVIAERSTDPEAREWAESIVASGRSLSRTGEKAREFDRLRDREPTAEAVDVETLLGHVLDDVAEDHPDTAVETSVATNRQPYADPSLLRVALRNLVENAVEHGVPRSESGDGSPVRVVVRDADSEQVRIDVADRGPGVPEAEHRPVLDGEESALDHGSGIGLWVAKWCVAAVGGELRFEEGDADGTGASDADTPPDRTTTVSVLLPTRAGVP